MATTIRTIRSLALLTMVLSILWLVLLLAGIALDGPPDSFERALARASRGGPLYQLSYYNAALITLAVTALFAALYRLVEQRYAALAVIGLVFVPVYCTLNLLAYLAQVTVVPALAQSLEDPGSASAASLLLGQLIQEWPASGAAFFNALAYALLGIPAILYGLALASRGGALRLGGWLLVLTGAACILGLIGILAGVPSLSLGTLIGGVLFIVAMPFLALGLS